MKNISLISTQTGLGCVRFCTVKTDDRKFDVYYELLDVCRILDTTINDVTDTLPDDMIRKDYVGRELMWFLHDEGLAKLCVNTMAEGWYFDLREVTQNQVAYEKMAVLRERAADREKSANRFKSLYESTKTKNDRAQEDLRTKRAEISELTRINRQLQASLTDLQGVISGIQEELIAKEQAVQAAQTVQATQAVYPFMCPAAAAAFGCPNGCTSQRSVPAPGTVPEEPEL
jgi:hypothetical protein